jgi:hypothetical protein
MSRIKKAKGETRNAKIEAKKTKLSKFRALLSACDNSERSEACGDD